MRACVCVLKRERERERESVCVGARVYVGVWKCACLWLCVWACAFRGTIVQVRVRFVSVLAWVPLAPEDALKYQMTVVCVCVCVCVCVHVCVCVDVCPLLAFLRGHTCVRTTALFP